MATARVGSSTGKRHLVCRVDGKRNTHINARQHPRQILNLPSIGLLRARAGVREEGRRDSPRDRVAARRLILTRGVTAGETRVEVMGAADGTAGTAMLGGGGGGIMAALPAPLGSLTELLRPPALPTLLMPLTPASWAKEGAVRTAAITKAKNDGLPNMFTLQGERVTNESRGSAFPFRARDIALQMEFMTSQRERTHPIRPGTRPLR